jgi:hypothetical protein
MTKRSSAARSARTCSAPPAKGWCQSIATRLIGAAGRSTVSRRRTASSERWAGDGAIRVGARHPDPIARNRSSTLVTRAIIDGPMISGYAPRADEVID